MGVLRTNIYNMCVFILEGSSMHMLLICMYVNTFREMCGASSRVNDVHYMYACLYYTGGKWGVQC